MSNLLKTTRRELEILQVLWQEGASSVRKIHEAIDMNGSRGYTTTLKLMQIMHEKGLLFRDGSERTHIYFAANEPERIQEGILDDLTDTLFSGSTENLVMRALSSKKIRSEELSRIRSFIDTRKKNQKTQ